LACLFSFCLPFRIIISNQLTIIFSQGPETTNKKQTKKSNYQTINRFKKHKMKTNMNMSSGVRVEAEDINYNMDILCGKLSDGNIMIHGQDNL